MESRDAINRGVQLNYTYKKLSAYVQLERWFLLGPLLVADGPFDLYLQRREHTDLYRRRERREHLREDSARANSFPVTPAIRTMSRSTT